MVHFYTSPPKNPRLFPLGLPYGTTSTAQGPRAWAWCNTKPFKGSASCGIQGMGVFPGCHPGVTSPLPGKMKECFCCVFPSNKVSMYFCMLYIVWFQEMEMLNHPGYTPSRKNELGGGFKYFLRFTPKIGEDEPILTSIFFNWVETTN